jgi:hypothetical protein
MNNRNNLNGSRHHFEDVLRDAEENDFVELATPRGPVKVYYVEDKSEEMDYWLFVLTRSGNVLAASQDEDVIIDAMNREGVSFRRGA